MSLTKTQLDSLVRRNVKASSVSYSAADLTADENLAIDRFLELAIRSSGKWQFDDSNHTDYPIIMTNIVSGQRDYAFTTDEGGNLILDIYKVMIKQSASDDTYIEIFPVDQQSDPATDQFWNGDNVAGIPDRYDKTANGLFLGDGVPNYNATNGLKVFINREGSYFTTSDTTKKPGIPGLFHEFIALYPSYLYALRNGLKTVNNFRDEISDMEVRIRKYFRDRAKDEDLFMSGESINSV